MTICKWLSILIFVISTSAFAVTGNSRTRLPEPNALQGEISSSLGRGFDYYADYFSTLGLSMSYKMSGSWVLKGEAEYRHVFTEFEERHTDSFEDTVVGIANSSFYRDSESGFNIDGGLKLRLPTSETSRRAGTRFVTGLGVNLSMPIGRARIVQSTSYSYYNQQFDTADEAGLEPNPIHAVGLGLGVSLQLTSWLTWSVGGQLHTIWDLESDRDRIEGFSSSLDAEIDRIWSISLAIQTRNKILSNNSLFDDDTTLISLGLAAKI